jgi:hypothetical protein
MDYEVLVEGQIEDGRTLISGLTEKKFDVSVAFWVRTSEENLWFLYVGTNAVRQMSLADAYRVVYDVLRRIPNTAISISHVKIVDSDALVAKAAREVRDRDPARLTTHYLGKKLGNLAIEEACIYPRTGEMTRKEVLQTVTGLMDRTGILAPSQVTLRDGTRIQAVPVGIQMKTLGTIQIILQDPATHASQSISADEVVSIL